MTQLTKAGVRRQLDEGTALSDVVELTRDEDVASIVFVTEDERFVIAMPWRAVCLLPSMIDKLRVAFGEPTAMDR